MNKIDFKKTLKQLYNPPKGNFHLVEVPEMNFLMVDGKGNPNKTPLYQQAIEALYSMSYGIKFALKTQGYDHIVPPPEGLWWMEDMNLFSMATKDQWLWTMMIMQPEWVTRETVEKVRSEVKKKKELALLDKVNFDRFYEGLCVQILYTGAYDDEGPTIAKMHEFIHTQGYQARGKHHEIYLGDVRKTSPERLQTILRQPLKK